MARSNPIVGIAGVAILGVAGLLLLKKIGGLKALADFKFGVGAPNTGSQAGATNRPPVTNAVGQDQELLDALALDVAGAND